mmetsp:Transcript_101555/g.296023  ORF Transcript_101555/g.296023 Transcript_101555/m.296023 type:complete len:131 (+) Transcript_101555:660-1052(+)
MPHLPTMKKHAWMRKQAQKRADPNQLPGLAWERIAADQPLVAMSIAAMEHDITILTAHVITPEGILLCFLHPASRQPADPKNRVKSTMLKMTGAGLLIWLRYSSWVLSGPGGPTNRMKQVTLLMVTRVPT